MTQPHHYPPGVPCWVDTWQPDPQIAARFYGALLGWEFDEPRPMPGGLEGQYLVARLGGLAVAGIGQAPGNLTAAVWSTHICVESIEETIARTRSAQGAVLVGPLEAGPDGRQAVLADADGVAFCIWQPGERMGAQVVNEPSAWTMSSLHAPSRERAEAFYATAFGWKLEALSDAPFALWRLPGYIGGENDQPMPRDVVAVMTPIGADAEIPPHWAVNFTVEDVDAVAERAIDLGGALVMAPMTTPGFRSAVIADPGQGVIAVSASPNR